MDQRISLITLGVDDLKRSKDFYRRLGWEGEEVQETVFFQAGGSALVLWDRRKLAADAGVGEDSPSDFAGVTLAHNVTSPAEVDQIMATAASAGAVVTREPDTTFYGGYAGCFRDPDGHVWEIAYNPGFPLEEDGSIHIPPFA